MDKPDPASPESETPDSRLESHPENLPVPDAESGSYVNEKIRRAYDRAKSWSRDVRESYRHSPRLQKVTYQGKFLPAFWSVATIFSLLVNIVLIAILVSIGRNFFALKSLVSDGLVKGMSDNLALMDKAHIVTTVPFQATVQVQDNLPVAFDVPIKEATEVTLTKATVVDATTYINGALVPMSVTLPMGTPLQLNMDMTIPVSQTIPLNLSVPVSLTVPLDVAVDQTDLHQSIIGMLNAIKPYEAVSATYNSSKDIPLCNPWWSGWLCDIVFGK